MVSRELLGKFVNMTKNPRNNQISLHLKKRLLNEEGFDIEDILNAKISKKLKEFKEGK